MSKKLSPKMRKTVGVMILSGTLAMGAFSLLQTATDSSKTNLISATQEGGELQELKVEYSSEGEAIRKYNAVPETVEKAKESTPFTFKLKNKGNIKQVVRLKLDDANVGSVEKLKAGLDGVTGLDDAEALANDKVKLYIENNGAVVFNDTLAKAIEGGENGFGKCFLINNNVDPNVGTESDEFKAYVYIDEKATNTDIFGTETLEPGQIKKKALGFKLSAIAVQYDGIFTGEDSDGLTSQFEAFIGKQ